MHICTDICMYLHIYSYILSSRVFVNLLIPCSFFSSFVFIHVISVSNCGLTRHKHHLETSSVCCWGDDFFFPCRHFSGAGQTAYGTPVDRISLGETAKTVDNFLKFLEVFFYYYFYSFSLAGDAKYYRLDGSAVLGTVLCAAYVTALSAVSSVMTARCPSAILCPFRFLFFVSVYKHSTIRSIFRKQQHVTTKSARNKFSDFLFLMHSMMVYLENADASFGIGR